MGNELQVTRTKILIPQRRREILSRTRLLDLLSDLLDFRLIIIAAPAGYGKTSLLIDFAHQFDWPVCWLALDQLDNDPLRFLTHFVMSIRNRFPDFGSEALNMLKSTPTDQLNSDYLIAALTNDIYEKIAEHFVLVLDDYHLVNSNQEIDQFLSDFIQRADDNCHVAITSRKLLTLPDLPLMVARAQVGGLSIEELVFQPAEIQMLYGQVFHKEISWPEAEKISAESEGWITGLLLTSPMLRSGMAEPIKISRASGIGLYEYLAQQVLEQQSPEIQDFLLNSSILEEFNAEMCRDVIGKALSRKADWPRLMETVFHNNLFVLPVDDEYKWLRYHHLFRDFLQTTLQTRYPENVKKIQSRLAEHCLKNQEWEKAFNIYRQLGDKDAIAALIEEVGSSFIAQGKNKKLLDWLSRLPDSTIDDNPALLSIKGVVTLNQGQVQYGKQMLDRVIKKYREMKETEPLAENLIRRSSALRILGNYEEADLDAEEAIQLSQSGSHLKAAFSEALRAKGAVLYQTGSLKGGLKFLKQALNICKKLDNREDQARILVEIGAASERLGLFAEAESAYEESLAYWQSIGDSIWIPTILNNLGVLQHSSGEFLSSFYNLEKSAHYSRITGNARMEGYALASIGDLYMDLDAADEAEEAYQKALEIAQQIEDQYLIFYLKIATSKLSLSRHDLKKAELQIQTAQSLARKSGSSFDTYKIRLEKCAFDFAFRKYAEVIEELELAQKYFSSEGHIEDSIRAEGFLMATLAKLGEKKRASALIGKFTDTIDVPARRIPSMVILTELQPIWKSHQNDKEIGPKIANLLERLREYQALTRKCRGKIRKDASVIQFAPARLEIRAFGKSEVIVRNRPLLISDWKTQTSRDLFFLFLAHPEGLSKEEVGELMWEELSPAELKLRFKNAIYRMRHAIGSEAVVFQDNFYLFNRSIDYEYDVQNFLSASSQAADEKDMEKKLLDYESALNLYQGPYLPDIDHLWVLPDRQKFQEIFIKNILELSKLLVSINRFSDALYFCQKGLESDQCNEEIFRMSMEIHAKMGNKSAIARQYELCVKTLSEEIGTGPSNATHQLYERLMA